MLHKVSPPERNTRTNLFRIRCSCGWFHISDTVEEVEARAATHDLEWVAVEPEKAPA